MAGGMGHGSGSTPVAPSNIEGIRRTADGSGYEQVPGYMGSPGGKGTSQATSAPPPEVIAAQNAPFRGNLGGKGTSTATSSRDLPPVARNDWQGTLARGLAQQRAEKPNFYALAASPAVSGDYAAMTSQALGGKKWEDLVPKAAEPEKKAEPAATPAPAAAPTATAEYNPEQPGVKPWGFNPSYLTGQLATMAHGGAIHGYARGGDVADEDIVKLALALLRRYQ